MIKIGWLADKYDNWMIVRFVENLVSARLVEQLLDL